MVVTRKIQSSVSYAEENQEKLIHAQQMAKLAKPEADQCGAVVTLRQPMSKARRGDPEGRDEGQVDSSSSGRRDAV
jgi:hypothetical protein